MKLLIVLALMSSAAFATSQEAAKTLPVTKEEKMVKADKKAKKAVKEEDCDTKAKKKVEITETSISLGGNNTGCSLDDAH